jgi:type IV pilus assembly protein PilB
VRPQPVAPGPAPTSKDATSPIGRRLGQLLVADEVITAVQLGQALAEQTRTNEKLGAVLVRLGFIDEDQLMHFLSRAYGIPVVALPESAVDPELLRLVPARIARKYDVIPVRRSATSLTLAMADPTNLPALDDVTFVTGMRVIPAIAPPSLIRRTIEHSYAAVDALTEAEAEAGELELVDGRETADPVDFLELKASADQAPVVRIVNRILLQAIRRGASDIHLEPSEMALRVRFRIDGMLHHVKNLPKRLEPAVLSRIKIMANLDIAERRLPQDGRLKLRYSGREIDFRVNVLPIMFGESASMRILDKEALKLDLGQLGFDSLSLEQFKQAIRSPHGMILMTGPTGSGKTTTLYSAIHAAKSPHINILTVEDPIEYHLEGVTQVPVNEEIGRSFSAVLRSFLRHDPDVILVGEMRDLETAQIAVRAALTGHLVLTTLHTNDSPSTISRLVDMGIPAFLIASAVRLVVAQRLVRKVCHACKQPYETGEDSLAVYGFSDEGRGKRTLYAGKGCAICNFTGMKGRMALFEVMRITPEIRDLITENAPVNSIRDVARHQGMRTLREVGLMKVLEGLTTVEEILRVTAD